ncbi:MAG: AraC family transcriptional regulator [Bacteroidaceae bacterium]|nr:AraC family transcriptional regulator [Bacteroidaceae bacterium]
MNVFLKYIITLIALFLSIAAKASSKIEQMVFERVDSTLGLGDNRVYHILQTRNGNMAITTHNNICLYNGQSFFNVSLKNIPSSKLRNYKGAYHSYTDNHNKLWIKDYQQVKCLDLPTLLFVTNIDSIFRQITQDKVTDLFVGESGTIWLTTDKGLLISEYGTKIKIPIGIGELQDLLEDKDHIFLFFSSTYVCKIDRKSGKTIQTSKADNSNKYPNTSLVIKAHNERFYQLRNGYKGAACFCFNTKTNQWTTLFETDYTLHTISSDQDYAYITSREDLWQIDLQNNITSKIECINLNGTKILPNRMNTIYVDKQNGIWLGSYSNGLLYSHPSHTSIDSDSAIQLDEYANATKKEHLCYKLMPLLYDINIDGQDYCQESQGNAYSNMYRKDLHIYKQKNITLTFISQNIPQPKKTKYLVRIKELENDWDIPSVYGGQTDNSGNLHLNLGVLKYGEYTIEVAAFPSQKCLSNWIIGKNTDIHIARIHIHVEKPWWTYSTLHFIIGIILVHLLLAIVFYFSTKKYHAIVSDTNKTFQTETLSATDKEFMNKAEAFVKNNLTTKGYSVEQLAADLCMERTGLYKKLGSIANITPSTFIKNIRMARAIELLKEGKYSVNEISELCGFSSSSYMSRCFQNEYSCTPLEYIKKVDTTVKT